MLDLVMQLLREGDTLKVTRLDRLSRSVLHLVRRMEGVGGCFDILPESAYNEDDAGDDGLLCLLLCDQAEPEMWDRGGDAILRSYSAPRPNSCT